LHSIPNLAQVREKLLLESNENEKVLQDIDGACFLVCLDDVSPTTGTKRIQEFMLGTGINRWHDKSLQFIVATNSSTAFICDHTKLDGSSVHQLLSCVKEAIRAHRTGSSIQDENSEFMFTELVFQESSDIAREVSRMCQTWSGQVASTDYEALEYNGFGTRYLKDKKCNTQGAYEVVAQLASYIIFGYACPCWQPVNMSHYHKGLSPLCSLSDGGGYS
jgi:carnitine O-acetyltransferase